MTPNVSPSHMTLACCFIYLLSASTVHALESPPPWTIEGCEVPTGRNHPVGQYTPQILNLGRMRWIKEGFWLQFSWRAEPQVSCGLSRDVLYYVQKKQDSVGSVYTFTTYTSYRAWSHSKRDAVDQEVSCRSTIAALEPQSYGFVSCTKDYNSALAAAHAWRGGVPVSFWLILVAVVVGLGAVVAVLGLIALILSRKKLTGFFSLHGRRLDSSMAPPALSNDPPDA